jgi:hypothetical protein
MAEINIMPKKANKSERKFKIGDIVFLLRGAHDPSVMRVAALNKNREVMVLWTWNGEIRSSYIHEDALDHYSGGVGIGKGGMETE